MTVKKLLVAGAGQMGAGIVQVSAIAGLDVVMIDVADEFLLGPDLLVAPVLVAGARERAVYLPAGARWRDAWSGEPMPAGEVHLAAAPLDRIPVYLRDDARLPMSAG